MPNSENREQVFQGLAASLGLAHGPALVIREFNKSYAEPLDREISPADGDAEVSRFYQAIDQARDEIERLRLRIQNSLEEREANVFDAHLLIVDDQILMDEVAEMITGGQHCAEFSFYSVVERYVTAISVMPDPYIKERANDIKDVASRVLGILQNHKTAALDKLTRKTIIVARDLPPSALATLDREHILALVMENGSNTSHTAILSRSLQIPAIVGIPGILQAVNNGDELIVDGFVGTLIVNPDEKTKNLYKDKAVKEEKFYFDLMRESKLHPETVDGFSVRLSANLDSLNEVSSASKYGMHGVGLFRTEYLYMTPGEHPGEDQLFHTFRSLLAELNGKPAVIRTLDIGGDKLSSNLGNCGEDNPFLGLRAIRLCLRKELPLLKEQIRAILRASAYGNLKIMFPMVSCCEELDELQSVMADCMRELKKAGSSFNKNIECGIMVETPAAVIMADELAEKVDFFSIGTNDLIQYTSAIDRDNESVAYLYRPEHPAIIRMMYHVVQTAKNHGVWVSVCGEMAGNLRYTPLLLGLGVDELSMSAVSIGAVRRIIRKLNFYEAEAMVKQAMACRSCDEVLQTSLDLLKKISPDITTLAFKELELGQDATGVKKSKSRRR